MSELYERPRFAALLRVIGNPADVENAATATKQNIRHRIGAHFREKV